MAEERTIKDYCPVVKDTVAITDNRPYVNQVKAVIPKYRDGYPDLFCKRHCYEGNATPDGCLYVSITADYPPMPGDLHEWISKTECVIRTPGLMGETKYSHQVIRQGPGGKRWAVCCDAQLSLEAIRAACPKYAGPGAIVGGSHG